MCARKLLCAAILLFVLGGVGSATQYGNRMYVELFLRDFPLISVNGIVARLGNNIREASFLEFLTERQAIEDNACNNKQNNFRFPVLYRFCDFVNSNADRNFNGLRLIGENSKPVSSIWRSRHHLAKLSLRDFVRLHALQDWARERPCVQSWSPSYVPDRKFNGHSRANFVEYERSNDFGAWFYGDPRTLASYQKLAIDLVGFFCGSGMRIGGVGTSLRGGNSVSRFRGRSIGDAHALLQEVSLQQSDDDQPGSRIHEPFREISQIASVNRKLALIFGNLPFAVYLAFSLIGGGILWCGFMILDSGQRVVGLAACAIGAAILLRKGFAVIGAGPLGWITWIAGD